VEGIKRIGVTRAQARIAFLVSLSLLLPFAFLFLKAVAGSAGSGIAKGDAGFARSKFVVMDFQPIVTTSIDASKTHCTESAELTLAGAESFACRSSRLRRQTCQAIHSRHARESLRRHSSTPRTDDSRQLWRKRSNPTLGVQILLSHFSFENCTLLNIDAATLQRVSRVKGFGASPELCESNDLLTRRHSSVGTTWASRSV
jgi:hypothetical protein